MYAAVERLSGSTAPLHVSHSPSSCKRCDSISSKSTLVLFAVVLIRVHNHYEKVEKLRGIVGRYNLENDR